MPTTTNYGWTTPADTDLVKDGAAAIRTLGSSIDSTLKTQIDAQIPDSLLTTKGDLIAATGASTPARLASSATNNDVLMIDTSTATGLKWAAPASGGMTLISSTTISTQASVVLSSIPSTYVDLYLVIRNFRPATDSSGIGLRINADTNARYFASSNNQITTFGATYIDASDNNIDNTVANSLDVFRIYDYANTSTWKMMEINYLETDATTTTSGNFGRILGSYNQTGAISSLTIFSRDGGNITSGTVLLYGVK